MVRIHLQDWLRAQGFRRASVGSYTWTKGPGRGLYKFLLLKDWVEVRALLPTPEILKDCIIGPQTWRRIASAPYTDLHFEHDKLRGLKLTR